MGTARDGVELLLKFCIDQGEFKSTDHTKGTNDTVGSRLE